MVSSSTIKEKPMSRFIFRMATILMIIRGFFRDKKSEVLLTGAKKGDTLLDFGCGFGFNTIPAAELVGKEGKVYALDIHPLAIEAVEKKIRKRGLKNVELILSNLSTGLADESVDIILLYNVLPMIKNVSALLKEMYRVIKTGGILSVKSGLIVKLYCGDKTKTDDLESLMLEKGPFKLEKRIGKFHIFKKVVRERETNR